MIDVTDMNVRYVTDKKGTKKEVILPIKDFEKILEKVPDVEPEEYDKL